MPRMKNVTTGVVVDVDEDLAERLDGYEPAPQGVGKGS